MQLIVQVYTPLTLCVLTILRRSPTDLMVSIIYTGSHKKILNNMNSSNNSFFLDVNPTSDIFASSSKVEYLICTKAATSEKTNPVIGFSLYHEPSSVIALLSDGNLVTLGVLFIATLQSLEDLTLIEDNEAHSPLKRVSILIIKTTLTIL